MLIRINRNPESGDPSGGAAPAAQPAADVSTGGAATANSGDNAPNAGDVSNVQKSQEGSQNQPASAPNFKELGARLNRGEILSDDELSALQERLSKGNIEDDEGEDKTSQNPVKEEKVEDDKDEKPVEKGEADPILEAMRLTGAKKADDLPALIKGLRDKMTASGGELGSQVKQLSTALETQHSVLVGLANGDPNAVAEFQRITGKPFNPSVQAKDEPEFKAPADVLSATIQKLEAAVMSEQEIADSIDPAMAARQNELIKTQLDMAKMNQANLEKVQELQEQNLQAQTMERARETVHSHMVDLATSFPEDYNKLTSAEIKKFTETYEKEGIIHPKFQPLLDVFAHAQKNGVSLTMAHRDLNFEKKSNAAPIIQKELEKQRNKILNQPTPNSISQNNNGGESTLTLQEVKSWKAGSIPEQYMGPNGLDVSKIPKNILKELGLA